MRRSGLIRPTCDSQGADQLQEIPKNGAADGRFCGTYSIECARFPELQSASAASPLPLAGQETRSVGRADQPDAPPILATQQGADARVSGRDRNGAARGPRFHAEEDITARRAVTIIDERLAKRLWPEGAIGKRLAVTGPVGGRPRGDRGDGALYAPRACGTRTLQISSCRRSRSGSLVIKTRQTAENGSAESSWRWMRRMADGRRSTYGR